MSFLTIILGIIILSIVVLAHEFGHFIMCKLMGVKVEEFGIGFPPRAVKLFKKGETLYSLNWIPFGGFNKILGEEENSKDSRAYNNQTVLKRIAIACGGIILNLLLAWFLLTVWYIILPHINISNRIVIVQISPQSVADKAEMKTNDIILKIGDESPAKIEDVSNFTKLNQGKEVTIVLEHQGKKIEKKVTLGTGTETPLGISMAETGGDIPKIPWYKAPWEALKEMGIMTWVTFDYLFKALASLFGAPKIAFELSGPVGMVSFLSQVVFIGWILLIRLAAAISLGLALFNILPIPAVDGGKLFFLGLEAIFGKKLVKDEHENIIHGIGFIALIALSILIAYLDIMRLK